MTHTNNLPVTTTYEDVERMLFRICWNFRERFGGDFDELLSQAGEYFMGAYQTYDSNRGAFTTWVYHSVYRRLWNHRRTENKRRQTLTYNSKVMEEAGKTTNGHPFDWELLLKDLTSDAKIVIQLIYDTPDDLEQMRGEGRLGRRLIRSYLRELGWTTRRVTESFGEIKTVLTK